MSENLWEPVRKRRSEVAYLLEEGYMIAGK